MMIQDQIASHLEQAFSQQGFAEPSVAELKAAAGVSLRTLYRHFPSKERMVVGALHHRHVRYLRFLADGEPELPGRASIVHLLQRLADWMRECAPHGCLSMSAFTAYPSNPLIHEAVNRHKEEMSQLLGRRSGQQTLSQELLLIHEGASALWPLLGMRAIYAAERAALKLIDGDH